MKCSLCKSPADMTMMFAMIPLKDHTSWRAGYCLSCGEKKFRDMANVFKRKRRES